MAEYVSFVVRPKPSLCRSLFLGVRKAATSDGSTIGVRVQVLELESHSFGDCNGTRLISGNPQILLEGSRFNSGDSLGYNVVYRGYQ